MSDRDATADWLLSVHGRVARIVAGSLLIIIGLGIIGGFLGVLLLILGAIPIASAAYGTLLVGPLLGRDIRGRRPEDQPPEEEDDADEAGDDDGEAEAGDEESPSDGADEPRKQADNDWSAPPLARAERPEGQSRRTKDLRADEPAEDDAKQ